ncbi:hypothetical protein DES53_108200 [Roseimicrobium gellanilyticum]|uniref:Uncharacterized protein n=1 Tax=Roseimicrobium gellanilyticum TaxID=748857 RepID=A0A366HDG5_9BACT|nr:hypothetical protein DES53_108200 [Roseimicrobium gellanilyticum]
MVSRLVEDRLRDVTPLKAVSRPQGRPVPPLSKTQSADYVISEIPLTTIVIAMAAKPDHTPPPYSSSLLAPAFPAFSPRNFTGFS